MASSTTLLCLRIRGQHKCGARTKMRTHIFHFITTLKQPSCAQRAMSARVKLLGLSSHARSACSELRDCLRGQFCRLSESATPCLSVSTDHEKMRLRWNGLRWKEIKINARARDHVHARVGDIGQYSKRGKFIAVNLVLKKHRIACGK